jgi:hypothetical protein
LRDSKVEKNAENGARGRVDADVAALLPRVAPSPSFDTLVRHCGGW